MNRQTIILLLSAVAIAIAIPFFIRHRIKKTDAMYRIALFAPAIHPAMDEINEGFMHTLEKKNDVYAFDNYNAQGNPTLLRAQAEEITLGNYDLIFTIGATCTQTIYELTKKKNISTPVVFTAVDRPVNMGIAKSLTSSENHLTGITSTKEYEKQIDLLLQIKPTAKNMLLVYDPAQSGGQDEDRKEIEKIVKTRKMQFQFVTISNANEIQQKVQAFMQNIDTIMILKDHTAVSGVDSLITLCNRYNVTLYATDHNSGKKGAALSYDVSEYEYGSAAAIKARSILEHHKLPSQLPISYVENRSLQINTRTAHKQGLNISTESIEKFKQQEGIVVL